MKMCRMWRVETRRYFYPSDSDEKVRRLRFSDCLKTTKEKVAFSPKFDRIGYGPYTLLKVMDKEHPVWAYGDWVLRQNEPENGVYAKFNVDNSKFVDGKLPPALWSAARPGPIEDPFLREYWLSLPFDERVHSVFGCATPSDCMKWFSDRNEVVWLAQNGFGLAEYRSKNIKHGLKQSVMSVKHPYKLESFSPFQIKVEVGVTTNGKW